MLRVVEIELSLAERSKSAVIRVVPGKGHATRILAEQPFIAGEIGDWLAKELHAKPE